MEHFSPDSPFYGLSITLHDPLKACKERYTCEGCKKSTRYYCYRCMKLAPGVFSIPTVNLPIEMITILKDARELEGKSTAVHAKLLASSQVEILPYDNKTSVKDDFSHFDKEETVLLFPDETSKYTDEFDWNKIKRVIVIDGTWQQAKAMVASSSLGHFTKHVKLRHSHKTLFWRYQNLGLHCLSTIEAIYRFCQEINPKGNFDDLLYFFSFQYGLIQEDYTNNPNRNYTLKHRKNYIQSRNPLNDA